MPTDQVGLVRKYTGGETPSLNRMGGADFEKQRARVRSAVREIAEELVVLYRQRLATPGHAFAPDTPVAARGGGGVPVRGDARPAAGHRRGEGRHGAADPDGPPRVRRRRVRQDRGRGAGRVQGGAGRQAGGRARARPRCSRASTARRSASASPTTRCGSRCCRASCRAKEQASRRARLRVGRGRRA